MKKLLLLTLLSSLLYACTEEDLVLEEVVTIEKPAEAPEEEKKEAVKIIPSEILGVYKETLVGQFKVSYKEDAKTFIFVPINASFNLNLSDMMKGYSDLDEWYKIVEGVRGMSIATEEKIGSGYLHAIMNPFNEENVILVVGDGTVLLDAFEGKE